ncbi:DeoR/GlpR transcriptional regulator [Lactiplantibacillus argentoratensis]|jgi:DeoR/GlpR family transcriptional regulator of sugar metabolism|nr:DeoR/GlpR transcriptional regulator [Lactiplantibacillus argentoratensis]
MLHYFKNVVCLIMKIFSNPVLKVATIMNGKERQNRIYKMLREDGSVKIHDLSVQFDVTRETARRDLYELSQSEDVKVIRGGAVLDMVNHETAYAKRLNTNIFAKEAIAKIAVESIKDGDTIYLDYGTTCLQIAKELSHYKNLSIVTNSLPIVNYLYKFDDMNVFVLGGDVRRNEESLYGDTAISAIKSLSFNIGFFSGSGLTVKGGLTNHHRGEATISRTAANQCEKIVASVDSSKYGLVYQNRILNLEDIDTLVIDKLEQKQQEIFKGKSIDVRIAN